MSTEFIWQRKMGMYLTIPFKLNDLGMQDKGNRQRKKTVQEKNTIAK